MKALVKYNGLVAGTLARTPSGYLFMYDPEYTAGGGRPVSITMPLSEQCYTAPHLFPVFMNMLSEGANKRTQMRLLHLADQDDFALLLATAQHEVIGPLTVQPLPE